MGLTEDFEKAAADAKSMLPASIGDKNQLILYSLFKQANFGDNDTKKPGMLDFVGKSKWEAWNGQKGKSKEQAMQEYIECIHPITLLNLKGAARKVEELKMEFCPAPAT